MHLKELIRNGNYAIFCPGCKFVYNKEKIEKILSFNNQNKNGINNLKKLLEKSNTKQMVLNNPELIFCPIANCEGYAKKIIIMILIYVIKVINFVQNVVIYGIKMANVKKKKW